MATIDETRIDVRTGGDGVTTALVRFPRHLECLPVDERERLIEEALAKTARVAKRRVAAVA